MTTINFAEERAKKQGGLTPKSLIDHLQEEIKKGDIESVVYVTVDRDGIMTIGHSQGQLSHIVGLLECGKQDVIEDMRV